MTSDVSREGRFSRLSGRWNSKLQRSELTNRFKTGKETVLHESRLSRLTSLERPAERQRARRAATHDASTRLRLELRRRHRGARGGAESGDGRAWPAWQLRAGGACGAVRSGFVRASGYPVPVAPARYRWTGPVERWFQVCASSARFHSSNKVHQSLARDSTPMFTHAAGHAPLSSHSCGHSPLESRSKNTDGRHAPRQGCGTVRTPAPSIEMRAHL